jgi:hypothetical protein
MARVLDFVPLKIGLVAVKPIDATTRQFYERVSQAATGEICTLLPQGSRRIQTLSEGQLQEHPESVVSAFLLAISETSTDASVLLLDAGSAASDSSASRSADFRGSVWSHLARAIASLTAWREGDDWILVVLVDQVPPEGDEVRQVLEAAVLAGRVVVLDLAGAYLSRAEAGSRVDPSLLPPPSDVAESFVDRFERKLIRRRGWFQAGEPGRERFVRSYYDCQLCQEELTVLIERHIAQLASPVDVLAYDPKGSPWLEKPVQGAAVSAGLVPVRLPGPGATAGARSLLVVPMVETGASLHRSIRSATDLGLDVQSVLTVLSSAGAAPERGKRAVDVSDRIQQVDYLLKVPQLSVEKAEPAAEPEHFDIPVLTYDEASTNPPEALSPYEYWDLVRDSGMKAEDNVPLHDRPSLGDVPNFPVMMNRYGTWLAHRLALLVSDRSGETIENLLFVLPSDEHGSMVLSSFLELVAGARVVAVPRSVLDSTRAENGLQPIERSELEAERPEWYTKLQTRSVDEVVFLDEFIAGGGTLRDFSSLGTRLDFSVRLAACIADFSPGKVRSVPIVAAYSVRRPLVDAGVT